MKQRKHINPEKVKSLHKQQQQQKESYLDLIIAG